MSLVDRDLVAEEREAARRASAGVPRGPRRSGLDDGTRWLALVAGGIGLLLVVTVGGWSLLGHRPDGIPVIEPLPGPVRVKPADPGGMQVMSTQVAQTNGPAAQALAPGPEAANPQALQAEVDAARHADAPPAATPAANPAPSSGSAPAAGPVVAAPVAAAPVPLQPAAPAAEASPAGGDAGNGNATDADAPAVPAADADAVPAGAGGPMVQLAALDSEAAAQAEWARLAHRAPSLFARRDPAIVPVSRDGKRFFRLRTAGFASAAEAAAFCGRLHGAGIACTVADF